MRFVGQVFSGGEVTLDYNEFVDCEIRDCMVLYHGGEFSLVKTKLTNVRFGLGGAASNTLAFLKLVRANGQHLLDSLLEQGSQPVSGQDLTIN